MSAADENPTADDAIAEEQFGEPPEDGAAEAIERPSDHAGETGVLRNSAVMAVGTVASRITGMARDIAVVAAIGFATLSDAYSLGNSLPNIIYILIVGGALNAVFVPQLVRHIKQDADRGDGYAHRLLTLAGIVLLLLSVVSVLLAPWIVRLYAPDDYSQADLEVAIAFTRLCLPQIFFYGLFTMLSQVLNSRGHFAMPMFAPIVNNLLVIGMALGFLFVAGDAVTIGTITDGEVLWLGIGTTLGVVLQALVLIPILGRVGYRYRAKFDFRGYGLRKTAGLAGWTLALVLANQLAFIVITRLATSANVQAAEAGVVAQGLTTYQKAYLVFILPHSVITVSIVTALLPRLSRSAADGRLADVAAGISSGARLLAALIVPCAAMLIVFGPTITTVLFSFGAGSGPAATYTGVVVTGFALGLLPFSVFYLLLRGWYSVEDTRTPFLVTVLFNLVMLAIAVPLYAAVPPGLKVLSLALAYAGSYWVTLLVSWGLLSRRLGGLRSGATAAAVGRIVAAGALAGLAGLAAAYLLRRAFIALTHRDLGSALVGHPVFALVTLLIGGTITVVVYLGACRLLRIADLDQVLAMIRSRLPGLRGRAVTGD